MRQKDIPVYVFAGFLEGGKTTMIKELLEDPEFTEGEKTLRKEKRSIRKNSSDEAER